MANNNENQNSEKKAYIKILKGSKKGEEIYFQFNPSEYTLERTNTFKEKKLINLKDMKAQFKNGQQSDVNFELLFDSTDEGTDVRDKLNPLDSVTKIDKKLHAPPPCMFIWGGILR
jgi:hypothetical protein